MNFSFKETSKTKSEQQLTSCINVNITWKAMCYVLLADRSWMIRGWYRYSGICSEIYTSRIYPDWWRDSTFVRFRIVIMVTTWGFKSYGAWYHVIVYDALKNCGAFIYRVKTLTLHINPLKPNDLKKKRRTAQLTSRCCILYIYSTNIGTEYFNHAA